MDDETTQNLNYRLAYGIAYNLFEAARFDHGWGRSFARDVKGTAEAILAEVVRQIGDTIDAATIEEAVEDVVAKRRPRW